jgi:hypothetical protein
VDLTVIVAAFGAEHLAMARDRAVPSAEREAEVILSTGTTVAESRNAGAAQATSEWICFLDADDEIEPGFAAAMSKATADVRAPAWRHCRAGYYREPIYAEPGPLVDGNMLPIGCVLRRELFARVGGFLEWPILEDWCVWQRCEIAGATFELVRDAVYTAHIIHGSRNRGAGHAMHVRVHEAIRRHNHPELYEGAAHEAGDRGPRAAPGAEPHRPGGRPRAKAAAGAGGVGDPPRARAQ